MVGLTKIAIGIVQKQILALAITMWRKLLYIKDGAYFFLLDEHRTSVSFIFHLKMLILNLKDKE